MLLVLLIPGWSGQPWGRAELYAPGSSCFYLKALWGTGLEWKVLDLGIRLCALFLGSPLCVQGQDWAVFLPPSPMSGVPFWFPHPSSTACPSTAFLPFSPNGETTPLLCAGARSWAREGRNCCRDAGGNAAIEGPVPAARPRCVDAVRTLPAGKGGEIRRSSQAGTGRGKRRGRLGRAGYGPAAPWDRDTPPRDSPRGWGCWERVWDGTGSLESPWHGSPGSCSLPVPQPRLQCQGLFVTAAGAGKAPCGAPASPAGWDARRRCCHHGDGQPWAPGFSWDPGRRGRNALRKPLPELPAPCLTPALCPAAPGPCRQSPGRALCPAWGSPSVPLRFAARREAVPSS